MAVPKAISSLKESEYTVTTILAVLIGFLGGFGAVGFRLLIEAFQKLFYGSSSDLLAVLASIPWYWKILIPAIGGSVVGPVVFFFAREAKGHGVPEVMEAVALRSGLIHQPDRRHRVLRICSCALVGKPGEGAVQLADQGIKTLQAHAHSLPRKSLCSG